MSRSLLLLAVVVAAPRPVAAETWADEEVNTANTPPEVRARGDAAAVWADHAIDFSVNPFYLRGDFDGDRRADFAVAVKRIADDGQRVVVLRGKGKAVWLEDGVLVAWRVVDRKTKVARSPHEEGRPPKLRGDAIELIWPGKASALVYWTGRRFKSYATSD